MSKVRMKAVSGLLLLLAWLAGSPVQAEQKVDLYQYKALVTSQNERERDQAITDGLAEVMVRVSGQPQILRNPQLLRELSRPERFYTSYGYEGTDETRVLDDGTEIPLQRLVIEYSASVIERLLRDLQLSIWPANRPTVLVWLVADGAAFGGPQHVGNNNIPEALEALQASTERRGIPLELPLLDLEDQVALPANRLWARDEERILTASARYNPDSVLVGRLTQSSSGRWQSNWLLWHRNQSEVIDSIDTELNAMIGGAIDQVADQFFSLYGYQLSESPADMVTMNVSGVDQFGEYADVLSYLEELAVVRKAELKEVNNDYLLLDVYTEGDRKLLQDVLALDKKLIPDNVVLNPTNATTTQLTPDALYYLWQ